MDDEWDLGGKWAERTYFGPAGNAQDTILNKRLIRTLTESTMQRCGSNRSFSAPWNRHRVRIALLHELVSRIEQR